MDFLNCTDNEYGTKPSDFHCQIKFPYFILQKISLRTNDNNKQRIIPFNKNTILITNAGLISTYHYSFVFVIVCTYTKSLLCNSAKYQTK